MASTLNKFRLDYLLRGIQKSIKTFEAQGHTAVYFTAQFFREGKCQNGIERGDLRTFNKQIRHYVIREDADMARVDFFSEATGRSIYSRALTELRISDNIAANEKPTNPASIVTGAYSGLGEAQVNEMVDRKFEELRRNDELQALKKEVEELRSKNTELLGRNKDLEASLGTKSGLEFYSGIINNALPGLANVLKGTPLEKAADFLSGMTEGKGNVPPINEAVNEETASLASMVTEFCNTLNEQETRTLHLLFMAFEADHSKIQKALQCIATVP